MTKTSVPSTALFIVLVLLSCLASAKVSAEPLLVVSVDSPDAPSEFARISVLEYNAYQDERLFEDQLESSGNFMLFGKDSAGTTLFEYPLEPHTTILKFDSRISVLGLMEGSTTIIEKAIDFCNNNDYCEPCITGICNLSENALSCADCRSGAFDGFCNPVDDGECDDDCDSTDPDCERIYGPADPITSEWVETQIELQNQPGLTITPSGERASTVLEAGIDNYCYSNLRGDICGLDEYCDGEQVEYYFNTFCCIGGCVYQEGYSFEEQGALPLYGEEVEFAENLSDFEEIPPVIIPFNESEFEKPYSDPELMEEAEAFRLEAEEELEKEEKDREFKETLEDLTPKLPRIVYGFNIPLIIGSLLVILLIILSLLAIFRRSAENKIVSSEKAAQVNAAAPVDLQSSIDSLISKGFNYSQVRDYLIRQGNDPTKVNSEIQKNYQKRKAMQVKNGAQ